MEATEREAGQTPVRPSHCETEAASGSSGPRDRGKKNFFFFSLSLLPATGLELVKRVCLSIQVWTLDRVLLCSQAITTAAGVFATALRIRPWLVALALRFNRRI